jgi:hypothetical protein
MPPLGLARRILKLFVDDTAFAAAIVAWMGGVAGLAPYLPRGPEWGSLALFGGLALILLFGVVGSVPRKPPERRSS